jgi:uncharacterized protein with GYD domain
VLFICYLNWTDQGAKTVKGVAGRHENLKAEIAGLGGRLVGGYVTRGQYDVVLVLEMPDGDAMTKLAVALASRGNVRTTTVRAYLPEEFGRLAAEVPWQGLASPLMRWGVTGTACRAKLLGGDEVRADAAGAAIAESDVIGVQVFWRLSRGSFGPVNGYGLAAGSSF